MIRHAAVFILSAATASADVPRVVTDIAPIHGLVARVMDGLGTPDQLIPTSASPHDFSLRPSQATALSEADLVFWVGEDLTPWLEDTLENLAPNATKVSLLFVEKTRRLPYREDVVFETGPDAKHDHDHDHGKAHDEDHGHDHDEAHDEDHGHDHDGIDAHAWLNIENGKIWLEAIGFALSQADPDNAALYAANVQAGRQELEELNTVLTDQLAGVRDLPFVVFHDAYQYFDSHFGLTALGALSLSDATPPSPARVAEVQDLLKTQGVRCLFGEPQFNSALAERLTEGTDVRYAVLDPLGNTIPTGPGFYPGLLQGMADALTACLRD